MLLRCLECFASNAYSCFSKAALTAMAVVKVLATISIIVIVAVKLEDVRVVMQIPDLTTMDGIKNLTDSLMGATTGAANSAPLPPAAPADLNTPVLIASPIDADMDLDSAAGPFRVNASCLLQKKRGLPDQINHYTRSMCSYVYAVSSISLVATFVMTCLLWCTCHLCGWGPILELSFALLGTAWWLAAALVLQENTTVTVDTRDAVKQFIFNNGLQLSPPPADLAEALLPPPPSPPQAPVGHDAASQLAALMQQYMPRNLRQWRLAVLGLSWAMVGMFAVCSLLLLVEACGCLLDCCGCVCRCCCCPERPESRWRANLRKRKRMGGGEEYVEMCGGGASSASLSGSSSGGGPPTVMVVARSDDLSTAASGAVTNPRGRPSKRGWWNY